MIYLSNSYFWIWCVICFLQMSITFMAASKVFETKINSIAYVFGGSLFCIVPVTLIILASGAENWLKSFLMTVLPSVFIMIFSRGSKFRQVMFYAGTIIIDSTNEIFMYWIRTVIKDHSDFSAGVFNENRIIYTLLTLLIMVPVKFAYMKLWNRMINKHTRQKTKPIYMLFPITQIMVYFVVVFEHLNDDMDDSSAFMLILIAFILLAISGIAYLLNIAEIEKKNKLELELADMEYNHRLEAEHYKRIEEKRYELAKIRHDLKNQLAAVRTLMELDNHDNARMLFYEIQKTLEDTVETEYCSIPIINAVISEKQDIIRKNGIEFTASISVNETGCVSQNHLCSIFANLIDNAVNANIMLGEGEKRFIIINTVCKGSVIAVKTVNPAVIKKDRTLDPSESSGYGLKILSDISDRYNGRFNIEVKDGLCTASITINTAE